MLTYTQSTGLLIDKGGVLGHTFQCYSGAGVGKNNPALQAIKNVGPLPCGIYDIGELLLESEHGPYAIRLLPRPENKMFGRAGFMLHGDSIEHPGCASEGCICLSPKASRQIVYESKQSIEVVP